VSSPGFLILIVAFAFLWFVLIRPQKRRQAEAARMLNSIEVGDEVLTAGGIYGEVTELHDDDVLVRIAPELEVRVARKAIGAVIRPEEPAEPEAEPEEPAQPEPAIDPVEPPKPEDDG
jgi:preprotein translocase subunit YajC